MGRAFFLFKGFGDIQVKDLPYETIANGHGPMLKFNMAELVEDYRSWSAKIGKSPACISVLYSDNYGFCDRLSQTLAHGITKADVATEMVDMVRAAPRAQMLFFLLAL
jgi:flavorubredoxin